MHTFKKDQSLVQGLFVALLIIDEHLRLVCFLFRVCWIVSWLCASRRGSRLDLVSLLKVVSERTNKWTLPNILSPCYAVDISQIITFLYWQTYRDLGLYYMCHGVFAALGKPSPNIDHYVPNIWPLTLTLHIDLDLIVRYKTAKFHIKTIFTILTFDLRPWPWILA